VAFLVAMFGCSIASVTAVVVVSPIVASNATSCAEEICEGVTPSAARREEPRT